MKTGLAQTDPGFPFCMVGAGAMNVPLLSQFGALRSTGGEELISVSLALWCSTLIKPT